METCDLLNCSFGGKQLGELKRLIGFQSSEVK
jgi:hypothetical protein